MVILDRGAVGFKIVWMCSGYRHDITSGRFRGHNTGVSILEDQTAVAASAQPVNRQQIALRVWLAYRDILGGNENPGKR